MTELIPCISNMLFEIRRLEITKKHRDPRRKIAVSYYVIHIIPLECHDKY